MCCLKGKSNFLSQSFSLYIFRSDCRQRERAAEGGQKKNQGQTNKWHIYNILSNVYITELCCGFPGHMGPLFHQESCDEKSQQKSPVGG